MAPDAEEGEASATRETAAGSGEDLKRKDNDIETPRAGQGMSTFDSSLKPPLGAPPLPPPLEGRANPNPWMAYLFGKEKGRGDITRPSAPIDILKPGSRSKDAGPHAGYDSAPETDAMITTFQRFFDRHSNSRRRRGRLEGGETQSERSADESYSSAGVCQRVWKDGGSSRQIKRAVLEASAATQAHVHKQIETWSDAAARNATLDSSALNGGAQGGVNAGREPPPEEHKITGEEGELVPPKPLTPSGNLPKLSHPSALLKEEHLKGLMAAVPNRMHQADWLLLYSTSKHGISLLTMYRRAAGHAPCVLLMKDPGGHVFGSYCSEAWKVAPRFFGTGESFVFQLEPQQVYYPWKRKHKVRNDYFMFGSTDSIGVGGSGHFAFWLDGELHCGHSGVCDTFGSPCLASKGEFKILVLELWTLL